MKKYFISQNGFTFGPYSFEDLRAMNLHPLTPVWFQGMPGWVPASQVGELQSLFYSNPQPYYQQPSPYDQPYSSPPAGFSQVNNPASPPPDNSTRNVFIILGAVFLVIITVVIFVVYSFKQRREREEQLIQSMSDSLMVVDSMQAAQAAAIADSSRLADSAEMANQMQQAHDNALGSSEYAGEYTDDAGGTVQVEGGGNYPLFIKINGNNCGKQIRGTGTVSATDEITMKTAEGCKIILTFSSTAVYVKESSGCDAYHSSSSGNCSFEGFYFKK